MNIISVLPYTIEGFEISQVTSSETAIQIYACSQRSQANCPSCGQPSASKHGWYSRQPQDISTVGRHLRLFLQVKRFRCQNKQCKRRTFAEQMPSWLPAYARRTQSLTDLMRRFALEIGAETSHRLFKQLEIDVSGDTLLRILRRFGQSQVLKEHFKIIGVDDWAFKRGKTYGTIIVNLESHQVIDLLPDRSAETLAAWLERHPKIEIVARDRSSEYSAGIRRAAPEAIQVADRWHLLLNLRQMLERYLTSIYAQLQTLPISEAYQQVLAQQRPAFRRTKTEQMASMRSCEGRLALYEQIQQLRQSGASLAQITACLDSHPITITKYFYASSFPERKPRKPSKSILDPFIPYLEQRLLEGCENAQQLWREIRDQGYPGGNKQVRQWLQMKRTKVSPSTPHAHQYHLPAQILQTKLPSSKQIAWLLVREPALLLLEDHMLLSHLQQSSQLAAVYIHAQNFVTMIRQRQVERLDDWLTSSDHLAVYQVQTFAQGLRQDYAAVQAALAFNWSNGQTEGQVNRLKFIKRQMYGRAKFDLLRIRVLSPP